MSRFFVLSSLIIILSSQAFVLGQVKDKTSVTVLKEYPEKPQGTKIDVLASEPRDRKFEDICMITATGGNTIFNSKKGSDLIEKMKEDARKCGADALIIRASEDQTWKPLRGGIDKGAKSQAVAIRFTD